MQTSSLIAVTVALAASAAIIVLNETKGLLSHDRFPNKGYRYAAYTLLTGLLVLVTALVASASNQPATASDLAKMPFWSLFTMHFILVVFLVCWWLVSGRPGLGSFFNLRKDDAGVEALAGVAIGVGGWLLTITVALAIGLAIQAFGNVDEPIHPPAAISWMAALPWFKKLAIVFSAMTFEELFFRGFLQKRVGLLASTVVFVIAHAGFGEPMMFIGITVVSLVIGYVFYRTKSLLPCIIAHGVFDAIQLFIVIPVALKLMPQAF
ncbi:MAG: type II CAAX endopeptidase family protein [Thermoanaerobaculia bacterium]|jgi:membrane protease YdiL (CAAX protease family)